MKQKKLNKALTLNKSTISDLNSLQMKSARGGYWNTGWDETCNTWCGCDTNFFHCRTELSYCCILPKD